MSDRTHSSVRTDSRAGDGPAASGTPGTGPDASTTQSITPTGSQRAQGPGTGSVPVVPQPLVDPPTGPTPSSASSSTPPVPAPSGPATGAGPVPDATAAATAPPRAAAKQTGRGPRRARLQLRHIDTWSALKISLVLSISLFFVWMVAVGVMYLVLNGLGVFDTINGLVGQFGDASESGGGSEVVTPGIFFWGAAIIGAINVVLLTALCTVATFMYNLCSDLVGGLELTLSERD
ncbi:DUF3566 domain-containing protein [Blastococcus saxobsidens]|uniref:DUF3566 domain-containing protein n=1 Tax=Blastococcus saxobsidens TaxID=138336 RepID=A0A6L9VZX4_9ACTN|nr:DUF3566 domain-containing protein [Blastococcus saxobsidens]NEK84894.1 DUF3566 domain-containing protein [Blastococcus saxobsidens]